MVIAADRVHAARSSETKVNVLLPGRI